MEQDARQVDINAALALAWLFVTFATQSIGNAFLRGLVRYAAGIWVTLHILNLKDEAQVAMASIAVEFGQTRLSLWLLVQAVVSLAVLVTSARFITTASAAQVRRNKDISPSMQVVSNRVSGLVILLDKSIKRGEVISLAKTFGWVSAQGARYVSGNAVSCKSGARVRVAFSRDSVS